MKTVRARVNWLVAVVLIGLALIVGILFGDYTIFRSAQRGFGMAIGREIARDLLLLK